MAQQIKKKFIAPDAIDGSRLLLNNGDTLRGKDAQGNEIDLLAYDGNNASVDGKNLAYGSDLSAEESARIAGDAAEASARAAAVSAEESARMAADAAEQSARAAAVSAEESARIAGDAAEASLRAAAVSAEQSARIAGDEAEAAARIAADDSLDSAIVAEQSARAAADATEQSARIAADNALQSQVDDLDAYAQDVRSDLDQEVIDRAAAVSAEQSARIAGDAAEQSARIAADANLQSQIDNVLSNVDPAALDSLTEIVTAFQAADSNLNNAIQQLAGAAGGDLDQEISDRIAGDAAEQSARMAADATEQSARIAADNALQADIDAEESARIAAVANEASLRAAADTTEQSARIAADTAEQSARIAGDAAEASARAAAVAAEQTARAAADATLQAAIDAKALVTLSDVQVSSLADKNLVQYDSASSKWKNVAPLAEASLGQTGTAGTLEAERSYNNTVSWGADAEFNNADPAYRYLLLTTTARNSNLAYLTMSLKRLSGTGNIYLNLVSNPGLSETVVATSNKVDVTTISSAAFVSISFNFADTPALLANTKYHLRIVLEGSFDLRGEWKNNYQSGDIGWGAVMKSTGALLTGMTAGQTPAAAFKSNAYVYVGRTLAIAPNTGVIKTNVDGLLDDSFLDYNVNFGDNVLSGVSAPVVNTDAANKAYVDSADAVETAARMSADTAEASARAAADTAEASARAAADTAEQSARIAADTAEASARAAADTAEQSARIAGDANEASLRAAAVSAEESARMAADANLQSQIDNVLSNVDPAALDSLTEIVAAFQAADSNLNNAIQQLAGAAGGDLDAEISARQAADTAEESARMAADAAEQSARIAAVLAEESARMAAVSAEQSARIAGDDALDARMDVLEARAYHKQKFVVDGAVVSTAYVDLSHLIIEGSLHVSVGRLVAHKDEDFTLSTMNGKTRISWAGSFMAAGSEEVVMGDSVFVSYVYNPSEQPAQ